MSLGNIELPKKTLVVEVPLLEDFCHCCCCFFLSYIPQLTGSSGGYDDVVKFIAMMHYALFDRLGEPHAGFKTVGEKAPALLFF